MVTGKSTVTELNLLENSLAGLRGLALLWDGPLSAMGAGIDWWRVGGPPNSPEARNENKLNFLFLCATEKFFIISKPKDATLNTISSVSAIAKSGISSENHKFKF